MRPICLPFCLGLALALGGCLSETPPVAPVQGDLLKPGDALTITVAGEDELSGGFAVGSDGAVRMELLGAVPAAGLSPPAFQDRLRQLLAGGYLKNPQVTVARAQVQAAPPLRQSTQ